MIVSISAEIVSSLSTTKINSEIFFQSVQNELFHCDYNEQRTSIAI